MRITCNQHFDGFLFHDRTDEDLFGSPSFLCDPILTGGLNDKRVRCSPPLMKQVLLIAR
jgi:hypothetical protein